MEDYEIFEVNGKTFSTDSFPPIDEKHIQNAMMVAPCEGKMWMFGWGCYNRTGDPDTDVWEWEPLYPFDETSLLPFLETIKEIRKNLGLE